MTDAQAPYKDMKSLAEMAAEAAGDDGRGIRCPNCGARHCPGRSFEVERTIALGNRDSVRRIRNCWNCRHRVITAERVTGVAPPTG